VSSLRDSLAALRVRIDGYATERRELAVRSGFTRVTTTVLMRGDDEAGEGEDVTYTPEDHDGFPADEMLAGTWTLGELSQRLDELSLWTAEPRMTAGCDGRISCTICTACCGLV